MFADQHVHSACSDDGEASMKDLAQAAIGRGLDCLCFTDHCDLEHYATGLYDPDCFDKEKLTKAFSEALDTCGDKITLRLGLELGAGNHMPDAARQILSGDLKFDLVIGSVHNFSGKPDFYFWDFHEGRYHSPAECGILLKEYVMEHFELVKRGYFDVIGHIGYPLRYMKRAGIELDLSAYYDELSLLFKLLIEKGKGIEVNTAGLRSDFQNVLPALDILRLYKQHGGEILTIGSDTHDTQNVGAGIIKTCGLLKGLGFDYFTVFKDRKPEFIKL